jgi:hypothetical protein
VTREDVIGVHRVGIPPRPEVRGMTKDELVSAPEAARILGVHRSVVHYLIERGGLTGLRLPPIGRAVKGHRIFLRRSEVEALGDTWRLRRPRRPRTQEGSE